MLAAQLVDLCRRHGFDGDDVIDALQWAAARLGPAALGSETFVSITLGDVPARQEAARPAQPAAGPADRYQDLGPLGTGGMGEVRRVRDRALNRTMALKAIRPESFSHAAAVARFVQEAQATAQLEHPGILPVHELGRLPDGRPYFTMKEVRGKTLGQVIAEVHAVSGAGWQAAPSGWTFRRLVDAFHRVCEAVAYAHDRGVVHRDLKPDNVMVGDYGEVLVLDWGLAKVWGRPDLAADAGELDVVVTDRSLDDSHATRMGAVAGTPAYMPPEQARGQVDAIDARSDVYALGAILYELLSGHPPYTGTSPRAVLAQVLAGPPEPPGRVARSGATLSFGFDEEPDLGATSSAGPELPAELVAACQKAMAREPGERFGDATSLAAEVAAWLDGARKREQALELVALAAGKAPEARALRARAAALREEAAVLLAPVKPWQPEADKAPGWALEDQAVALERQAALAELAQETLLQGSLTHFPHLPEAHAALAATYRAEHEQAEADRRDASRQEVLLRTHVAALPEDHPDRRPHLVYLRGDGALTLHTDPPGAEVLLHRYELRNRRLVPVFERSLGRTPLVEVTLPLGSYLCILRHPDRAEVRYPVSIRRGEHWHGVPPRGVAPHPVWLPRRTDLAPDDCYLPAGWFWSGGDPESPDALPVRRLWCAERVIQRFPVTNRAYIAFLDDLVARGREDEALQHVPRQRGGKVGEIGAMIFGRRADGSFVLVPDAEGDCWAEDWPVCMLTWGGAVAYARWHAARTGLPWRLPGELEWEKAARGVDGRLYPWGDVLDLAWCCIRGSHPGRPLPDVVDSFPVDESPFGVRGMAGNMRDMCAEAYRREGPPIIDHTVGSPEPVDPANPGHRTIRGGAWFYVGRFSRGSWRDGCELRTPYPDYGFRLLREVVPS